MELSENFKISLASCGYLIFWGKIRAMEGSVNNFGKREFFVSENYMQIDQHKVQGT